MKLPMINQGMVQTALGSIFYMFSDGRNPEIVGTSSSIVSGDARSPILCFHMSPRSSDEFLEVLPLLASPNDDNPNGRIAIAFDMPGYGSSENPPKSCTIDEISDAFLEVADSLMKNDFNYDDNDHTSNFITVGSLLGNFCCVSLAARYPERIKASILTNPWFNPMAGENSESKMKDDNVAIKDSFVLKDDGSHLVDLHSKRNSWLDPELNFRVVNSEIAYLAKRRIRYAKGINIEGGGEYDFEKAVNRITSNNVSKENKFLCIKGEACAAMFDTFGLDGTNRFEKAYQLFQGESSGNSDCCSVQEETLTGEKSTLNVINQMPEEFNIVCQNFLSKHKL